MRLAVSLRGDSAGPCVQCQGRVLQVNPVREKKLTNIRTTAADEKVFLQPPRQMTLEDAIGAPAVLLRLRAAGWADAGMLSLHVLGGCSGGPDLHSLGRHLPTFTGCPCPYRVAHQPPTDK